MMADVVSRAVIAAGSSALEMPSLVGGEIAVSAIFGRIVVKLGVPAAP